MTIDNPCDLQCQTDPYHQIHETHSSRMRLKCQFDVQSFPGDSCECTINGNCTDLKSTRSEMLDTVYKTLIRPISCYPNVYKLTFALNLFYAMPFYFFVTVALFAKRKTKPFDSVFYRLTLYSFINDLLQNVHTYFLFKIPAARLFLGHFFTLFNMQTSRAEWANQSSWVGEYEYRSVPGAWLPYYVRLAISVLISNQFFFLTLLTCNRFTAMWFMKNAGIRARVRGFSNPSCIV